MELSTTPASDAVLRFGYTPPSLARMQRHHRAARRQFFARVALSCCTIVLLATGAYAGNRTTALAAASTAKRASYASKVATVTTIATLAVSEAPNVATASSRAPRTMRVTTMTTRTAVTSQTATNTATSSTTAQEVPHKQRGVAPHAMSTSRAILLPPPKAGVPPLDTADLRAACEQLLSKSEGTYSVDVIDLSTEQQVEINADVQMDAASVNKLEVLGTLIHEVELDHLKLSETLTTTTANIQDYGTGVIRYQPLGTTYTLSELATLLIEQSDNTASYMLGQRLGLATINAYAASLGLTKTQIGPDVSSAQDAARFMELLYDGKIAGPADTRQMLDYLTHTAFNDRIPAGLPAGTVVAHKIGNAVNVENDVAIVLDPKRPYILSIFSANAPEDAADSVERALSQTVFSYEHQASEAR